MTSLPKFLTIDEVAGIARAPRSTVLHWVYTKKLASRRVGRRRLITEDELSAFLKFALLPGSRGGR